MNLQDVTDRVSTQDFVKLFQSQPDRSESLLGSLALLGAGALIGAALALLFAPKAGSELRHDVGDQLRAAGDQVAETMAGGSPRNA
jgi:YtxH-like protein